jgi:hypothetical protein
MIIKGNRHSNGAKLAAYLMNGGKHGERVEAPELRGFGSYNDDMFKAFSFLHVMAEGEIENPLFHVQVRLPEGEQITREQWELTADRIEKRLGLTGQPRALVYHIDEQTGERHIHLTFSLIDEETLHAKPVDFFKRRMKALARELEKEFDITRVKNEREGPIKYAAKKNEQQQAQRLDVDKDELRNTIRACWDQSDCGKSFQAALEHEGMILAQGDQRGLVVVDHAGGVHALGKRILDVNKKAMLERLADLDITELPSVQQTQSFIREMQVELQPEPQPQEKKPPNWNRDRANQSWEDAVINAAIEQEKIQRQFVDPKPGKSEARAGSREKEGEAQPEQTSTDPRDQCKDAAQETAGAVRPQRPLQPIEQKLWGAYRSGPAPDDFAAALDSQGVAFARVTGEEANKSYREGQFAKAVGRTAPVYQEGEIVVVRTPGPEYLRQREWTEGNRAHRLDQAHAEKYLEILSLDKSKLKGIEATKTILDTSAQERAAYWQDVRMERAATIDRFAPVRSAKETTAAIGKTGGRAIGAAFSLGEKFFDTLFALLDPPTTPLQRHQAAEKARDEREAQAEHQIDFSRWTADRAQERQNHQEQQAARDRQRESERER